MATPLRQAQEDPLAALRDRLDEIDDELHRLLAERFRIAREIGRTKGADEPVMRPAREAEVLARRLAVSDGAVPEPTLVHLWRVIVAAACTVQRPYAVNVAGALDAARFLFGPVPVARHDDDRAAVAILAARPDDVAVVDATMLFEHERWRGTAHVVGMGKLVRPDGAPAKPVAVLGGANVARGAGSSALVVRDGALTEVPAAETRADDLLVGRYDPFPISIPVAQ